MSKSRKKRVMEADVDEVLEDKSGDIILDMYEEDIECDMDCRSCTPLERMECVGEMKQALLVTIQKLNQLYSDFNTFSRKIFKLLNVNNLIDQLRDETKQDASTEPTTGPAGFFT